MHLDVVDESRVEREEEKVVENRRGSKREPREFPERDREDLTSTQRLQEIRLFKVEVGGAVEKASCARDRKSTS